MGKLFGNMWSSVNNHYGMTPLALTENPEVRKSSFNVLSVTPLLVNLFFEFFFCIGPTHPCLLTPVAYCPVTCMGGGDSSLSRYDRVQFDGSVTGLGGELLKTRLKLFSFGTCISNSERLGVESTSLAFVTFELFELAL
jgi:hypothetical protein